MKRLVSLTLLAGLVFASGYLGYSLYHYLQQQQDSPTTQKPANALQATTGEQVLGNRRPEFTLPDLDGRQRSITEWDGKVLALNFWATWVPTVPEGSPGICLTAGKVSRTGVAVYRYRAAKTGRSTRIRR